MTILPLMSGVSSGRRVVLVAVAAVLAGFAYGYIAKARGLPPDRMLRSAGRSLVGLPLIGPMFGEPAENRGADIPGRWREVRKPAADLDAKTAQLLAIGYMDGYEPARDQVGVTVNVVERAEPGTNLYVSGHGEEAVLMDMAGKVLHRWRYEFARAFADGADGVHEGRSFGDREERWRRAHLFPNGDLLAIYEGLGIIKLDKNSKLLWARANNAHHDLHVDDAGRVWTLTREAHVLARINPSEPVLEDFITVLDADGNDVRSVSVLEAFERSAYAPFLESMDAHGDVFHTNTIEVLDGAHAGRSSVFKRGNVLISVRNIDVIAIVDMETEKVVWALAGLWHRQHQPTLLPSGRMLVFDNLGNGGNSRVLEIDPLSQELVWSYADPTGTGFQSATCGSNQRLANGNTLISESDSGRAFEVTRDGRVVWEFYNPARAGENDELIATLFEVVRLPADFPTDWASAPKS